MSYVPVTYIPDGPVTSALKEHVKKFEPEPKLGNLGPLLDENLTAAQKHGHFLYHPDDLQLLKDVDQNPEIVEKGFIVLRRILAEKGIEEPQRWKRTPPYYRNFPQTLWRTAALAAVMAITITIAVLLGQDNNITAMIVAISLISVLGAGIYILILARSVIRVGATTKS